MNVQVQCDDCDWWYYLRCIIKQEDKRKEIPERRSRDSENFHGPCGTVDGQFKFSQLAILIVYT